MTSRSLKLLWLAMALGAVDTIQAQNAETLDMASRFKDANTVLWERTEHLRLKFDDRQLVGESEISREVLLLSERAPRLYNEEEVYHGFLHKLEDIEAVTLVPKGEDYKSVKATELATTNSEESNIFYTDSKKTTIKFSNLSQYAKTKLHYTLRHHDVHFLQPFYFQSYMPTRSAVYTVTTPKGVQIGYHLQGNMTDRIAYTMEERRNEIVHTWKATNMPRSIHFSDGPAYAHITPHVVVYVKEYTESRGGRQVRMLGSVADLYSYFSTFLRDVNLQPDAEMSAIVDSLTKHAVSDREKAAAIYAWVQANLRYVAYEDSLGGFIPRPAALVCSRRFGDCKDMTSALVAMCRKAGLNAHFAWIGTRDIPYNYEALPSPLNDNHMICLLSINNEWVIMDGTDRNIPFANAPANLQDKEALVAIDDKTFKVIRVPVAPVERNAVHDTTRFSLKGEAIEGEVNSSYSGYGAWRFASMLQYSSGEDKEKLLRSVNERGSDKYVQTGAKFTTTGSPEKRCMISARFSVPEYVKQINKETYVNMNLQKTYGDAFIDKAERSVPLEYSYKQHLRQVVSLKIPDGYKASYLPPDIADSVPELWSYKFHYEQKGSEIILVKEFFFNMLSVKPEKFSQHNRLVEGIRQGYNESVVLSKIN